MCVLKLSVWCVWQGSRKLESWRDKDGSRAKGRSLEQALSIANDMLMQLLSGDRAQLVSRFDQFAREGSDCPSAKKGGVLTSLTPQREACVASSVSHDRWIDNQWSSRGTSQLA